MYQRQQHTCRAHQSALLPSCAAPAGQAEVGCRPAGAPWVEGGSQLQKGWNPLLLTALDFPAYQEWEKWRNFGVPQGYCRPTSLRATTGTLSAPGLPSAQLNTSCSLLFHSTSCSTVYKATTVQEQAAPPPPAQSELSTCTLEGDLHFI